MVGCMLVACDAGERPRTRQEDTSAERGSATTYVDPEFPSVQGPTSKRMDDFMASVRPLWDAYCAALEDVPERDRLFKLVSDRYMQACGTPLLSSGKLGCDARPELMCQGDQRTPPSTPVMPLPSEDLLTRLRRIQSVIITSDAQDAEHWTLAERVANERLLVGLRKEEIERKLGPGAACDSPSVCDEGFRSEDWYYEIGRLPERSVGGTPILVVDFDPTAICIGSRVIHTQ